MQPSHPPHGPAPHPDRGVASSHARDRERPAMLLAVLTPAEVREFFPEPQWADVRRIATEFRHIDPTSLPEVDFAAALRSHDPEVLLACWKTPALPAELPRRLRYVCYLTGSVRRLVSPAHLAQGLLLSNWGESISRVVAEGALFHVLACLRRATVWSIGMHRTGAWKDEGTQTASLFGRKVGLHGFGPVARELVKLMRPFGVEIGVTAPDVTPALEREWSVSRVASLEALFAESDIIVEVAPLNRETRRAVQERHLRLLRPGSVFVNVGRADVVDEEALVRVAREGRVQFGLDVFSVEPLPVDHPLRGLLNVSLTPHIAGPTTDRRCDAGAWALRNLRAYAAGEPVAARITQADYEMRT